MMTQGHPRMAREKKTIKVMVGIYCQSQHGTKDQLCAECLELLNYATLRLDNCPFQENKTTCANCPVHCYKPAMRERIKIVMRYAGPRMLYRHPILALLHLVVDSRRKEPRRAER